MVHVQFPNSARVTEARSTLFLGTRVGRVTLSSRSVTNGLPATGAGQH